MFWMHTGLCGMSTAPAGPWLAPPFGSSQPPLESSFSSLSSSLLSCSGLSPCIRCNHNLFSGERGLRENLCVMRLNEHFTKTTSWLIVGHGFSMLLYLICEASGSKDMTIQIQIQIGTFASCWPIFNLCCIFKEYMYTLACALRKNCTKERRGSGRVKGILKLYQKLFCFGEDILP